MFIKLVTPIGNLTHGSSLTRHANLFYADCIGNPMQIGRIYISMRGALLNSYNLTLRSGQMFKVSQPTIRTIELAIYVM